MGNEAQVGVLCIEDQEEHSEHAIGRRHKTVKVKEGPVKEESEGW